MLYIPTSVTNNEEKEQFVENAQLITRAHVASAIVFVLESWISLTAASVDGEGFEKEPDPRQVVVITVELPHLMAQQTLFVRRNADGEFIGFAAEIDLDIEELPGRFAPILPAKAPTLPEILIAKAVLKERGVIVYNRGNAVWS